MADWSALRRALGETGQTVHPVAPVPVGGGDTSAAWRIESDRGPLFIKTAKAASVDLFAAEAEGLKALRAADAVRVPRVLAEGVSGGDSFLLLEWLDIVAASPRSERRLGEQLALQHRVQHKTHGWHRDNTIGASVQVNRQATIWSEFFVQHRLNFQLELAIARGFDQELRGITRDLSSAASSLLAGHEPPPSLLHGDLWAGNHAAIGDDEPVVFDPAVYFGDRETDLAMTRLFGGFSEQFYSAYEAAWPLPEGHERRTALYQLYHVLNHVNIFGRSYLGRALAIIKGITG